MLSITSRDNPLLKELRKLGLDNLAYRKQNQVWLEGEHLCSAALLCGQRPLVAIFAESKLRQLNPALLGQAAKEITVPDKLFAELCGVESPSGLGFVIGLPQAAAIAPLAPTVILDRVQDAGNVGSILRSAAAFGFQQVLALKGGAGLWSPKVLRAGMGAHFALQLHEGLALDDLAVLQTPILATSSHTGQLLHTMVLPKPSAWAFGHEGRGICAALQAKADGLVRIHQPGGEESLNVAAAAAVCLHASAVAV